MGRVIKKYELRGFNECQTSTIYCGVKVNLTFKDGNTVQGKNASLMTDIEFAQHAIENDFRFKNGNIILTNTITEEEKKEPVITRSTELQVIEDVKTITDADEWFSGIGVTLESGKKQYVLDMCEQYNVKFPNLKFK